MSGAGERRQRVLAYIEGYYRAHGVPPALQEIADGVGLASSSTVALHVQSLVARGQLREVVSGPGVARRWVPGCAAKPLVYIAGPYRAETFGGVVGNISAAREQALQLAREGVDFFCPHTHTGHFDVWAPEVPEEFYLELDLRFLRLCNAILMLPRWQSSSGARREFEEAQRLGLPVFYGSEVEAPGLGELAAWAKGGAL